MKPKSTSPAEQASPQGVHHYEHSVLPPLDLGAHLRALRQSYGLSQRALARQAGVTNATVSNIELNQVSPSVASLTKIVHSMGLSLANFFAANPEPPGYFYRADSLVDLGTGGTSLRLVAAGDRTRTLQVMHERYAPGSDTGPEMLSHPGEEGGVVVEGEITIYLGDLREVLGPGDAYQFPSTMPHRFLNEGDVPCVLVSSSTPPTF
ncbi:MAG: transcriptional regulator with XRE-family HTH domain [Myxococcota bacterium]|jgi:transcriptional regulator with XRE-family HTH domain